MLCGVLAEQDSLLSNPHGRHSTMEPPICFLPAMDKEGPAVGQGVGPSPAGCFCPGGEGSFPSELPAVYGLSR